MNDRERLCKALGIPPQFYRDSAGIDHEHQEVDGSGTPIWPPIDTDESQAVRVLEAMAGKLPSGYPCAIPSLASDGSLRWYVATGVEAHSEFSLTLPGQVAFAGLAALDAGAFR